jgi:prepilin-type N-terminal cleavage/methylation domain-containing protein
MRLRESFGAGGATARAGLWRARHRGSSGFTFLELAVVIAILAVAVALVLPGIGGGTESLRLRSQAARVVALLRQARQHAVSHHRTTQVTLDRVRNRLALVAGDPDHPLRELEIPAGLRLSVESGGETLKFSSRGLTRETHWVIEAPGGRALSIRLDALTGRVSVAPGGRS